MKKMPGLPNFEKADCGSCNDFLWSQSEDMSRQTVNDAFQQETAFIPTPGISPSALLNASDHEDDVYYDTPLQRLLKMVRVVSPKALSASIRDMESVVCMSDRIASSAPLIGSRAATGDNLAGETASCLRKKRFSRYGGVNESMRTKYCRSSRMFAITSKLMDSENVDLNSTAASAQRSGIEKLLDKKFLLEEIRNINKQLIDMVVSICDEDTMTSETAECSFVAVLISPTLIPKQQYIVHPLKLLVPKSYPCCSPILKKLHVEACQDYEDLSFKAMEKLNVCVQSLPHPFSVSEVARMWDLCARTALLEYAQQNGGGSFTSKYGTWEDCR